MKPRILVRALPGRVVLAFLALGSAVWAADAGVTGLRAKAENGNAIAQYNLGLMYLDGDAVPQDPIEAYVWLSLAAENGATGRALRTLTETMPAEQLAVAKSRLAERRSSIPSVVTMRAAATATAGAAVAPAPVTAPEPAAPASPAAALPVARGEGEVPGPPAPVPGAGAAAAGMDDQLAALQADKTRLAGELAAAAKDLADARTAVVGAEQRAKEAEAALGQHAKEIIVLQTEREQMRQELAAAPTAAAVAALQQERDRAVAALTAANADAQTLRQRVAGVEAENGRLQRAAEAARAREATLADQAQKLTALTAELNGARQELATAQAAGAGVSRLQTQVEALTTQLAAAHKDLEAAQAGRNQAAGSSAQLETARQDLAAVRSANGELGAQVKKLADDKAALAAANADLTAQVRSATAGASALQQERDRMTKQLAAATGDLEALRPRLAALETENGQLRQAAATQPAAAESAAQMKKLAEENTALAAANSKLEAQLRAATQAAGGVPALQQERDRLAERLATANADMQSLHDRLTQLEAANGTLEQTGAASRSAAARLADQTQKVAALSAELETARQLPRLPPPGSGNRRTR